MFWSTAQKYGQQCVEFLLTPPPKGADRQAPLSLAALVNLEPETREWSMVVDAMHEYAWEQDPPIPLTWAPDLHVWVARPTPGDFLANIIWDMSYDMTRLNTNAKDAMLALQSISDRAVAMRVARAVGVLNGAASGMRPTEQDLRVLLADVRDDEYEAGLI